MRRMIAAAALFAASSGVGQAGDVGAKAVGELFAYMDACKSADVDPVAAEYWAILQGIDIADFRAKGRTWDDATNVRFAMLDGLRERSQQDVCAEAFRRYGDDGLLGDDLLVRK